MFVPITTISNLIKRNTKGTHTEICNAFRRQSISKWNIMTKLKLLVNKEVFFPVIILLPTMALRSTQSIAPRVCRFVDYDSEEEDTCLWMDTIMMR